MPKEYVIEKENNITGSVPARISSKLAATSFGVRNPESKYL